jgi:hypothetical protein
MPNAHTVLVVDYEDAIGRLISKRRIQREAKCRLMSRLTTTQVKFAVKQATARKGI